MCVYVCAREPWPFVCFALLCDIVLCDVRFVWFCYYMYLPYIFFRFPLFFWVVCDRSSVIFFQMALFIFF